MARVDDFLAASDQFLDRIERRVEQSRREVEPIQSRLTLAVRTAGLAALATMQTIRSGGRRILAPTSSNLRAARQAASRFTERFRTFSSRWLDRSALSTPSTDPAAFASHAQAFTGITSEFLGAAGLPVPTRAQERQAQRFQIEDNAIDVAKLQTRAATTLQESLVRSITGRSTRSAAEDSIRSINPLDIGIVRLSLVEHPRAVARGLLAVSANQAGGRIFVGAGPAAIAALQPGSRTAALLWRDFSEGELDALFAQLNASRSSTTTWRGLGLAPNTNDLYLPTPREIQEEVLSVIRQRRGQLLSLAQ